MPDAKLRRKIVLLVRLAITILAAIFVAVTAIKLGPKSKMYIPMFSVTGLAVLHIIGSAFYAVDDKGRLSLTGIILDAVVISGMLAVTGGIESPVFPLYVMVLMIYAMERSFDKTLVASIISVILYLAAVGIGSFIKHDTVFAGILNLKNMIFIILLLVPTALAYLSPPLSYVDDLKKERERLRKKEEELNRDEILQKAVTQSRSLVEKLDVKEKETYEIKHQLHTLIEMSQQMSSIRKPRDLMELIVKKAKDTMNSDKAFIMLREGKSLTIHCSMGIDTLTEEDLNEQGGGEFFKSVLKDGKAKRLSREEDDTIIGEMKFHRGSFKTILAVPLKASNIPIPIGLLCVVNLRVGKEYTDSHENYLKILASNAAIALRNIFLYDELRRAYLEIIQALAQAIEAKDPYTHGHVDRVRDLSLKVGQIMKLPEEMMDKISRAAILHDVGKISTPESILLKPDKLTDDEFKIMKDHARASIDILDGIKSLEEDVLNMIVHHHERYDGNGYPDGLKGEEIPLGAQIIAVADVYDALTTHRPYRKAWTMEKALSVMKQNSGAQFNPIVLNAFLKALDREDRRKTKKLNISIPLNIEKKKPKKDD